MYKMKTIGAVKYVQHMNEPAFQFYAEADYILCAKSFLIQNQVLLNY